MVLIVAVGLLLAPLASGSARASVHSEDQARGAPPADFGFGAASVLATIPYGLAKLTYAGLGTVIGGCAYLFSGGDRIAAKAVWTASLRGTYVLTPEHLKGERPIQFIGVPDAAPVPEHVKLIVVDPGAAGR
ncbi:hypothetical protein [Candidatus Nitrospira bockiana]